MPQAPDTSRLHPKNVWVPEPGTPWLVNGRSRYPTKVTEVRDLNRPLVFSEGRGNAKIGSWVSKGKWRGMPIYLLTLEERATCPKSCTQWNRCYGNSTPFATRVVHGKELEARIERDLATLSWRHPHGYVIRLHQLGDFYSVGYVRLWERMLNKHPALRCYGYTAWPRKSAIGAEILKMTDRMLDRFAIRFSGVRSGAQNAVASWNIPHSPVTNLGNVCPEQLGMTPNCGACGLCWADAFKHKPIVFIGHGQKRAK